MNKYLILLLGLALGSGVSDRAMADERTVRGGGGLGEMKAIYLHQNLGLFLDPCFRRPKACGLEGRDAQALGLAFEAIKAGRFNSLEIDASLPESEIFSTEDRMGAPILLSAHALYRVDGSSRTGAEIAGFLLAAFWSQVDQRPKRVLLEIAERVTRDLTESVRRFAISASPVLVVNHYEFRLGERVDRVLVLEDRKRSLDVSDRLPKELALCRMGLNFENWRATGWTREGRVSLRADVRARCGDEPRYRVLVVEFLLSTDGSIEPASLVFKVRDSI